MPRRTFITSNFFRMVRYSGWSQTIDILQSLMVDIDTAISAPSSRDKELFSTEPGLILCVSDTTIHYFLIMPPKSNKKTLDIIKITGSKTTAITSITEASFKKELRRSIKQSGKLSKIEPRKIGVFSTSGATPVLWVQSLANELWLGEKRSSIDSDMESRALRITEGVTTENLATAIADYVFRGVE